MKKAEVEAEIDNEKGITTKHMRKSVWNIDYMTWIKVADNQPGPSSPDEPKGEVDGVSEMNKIRKFLTNLKIFDTADKISNKQILNELTLDGIVEFIKKPGCKKIITMVGAGISTCK